jgi:hypothetical protein
MHPLSDNTHTQDQLLDSTEERRLLDLALQPLFNATPDLPYILHIPCPDLPFDRQRLRNEQEQWHHQFPLFKPDELHRQYTTLLFRDRADSCFHLRTEVDEERDRKARERQTSSTGSGPPIPPHPTIAKKKISLAEYKNKLAGADRPSPKPLPDPAKQDPSKSSPETNFVAKMNGTSSGRQNGSSRAEHAVLKAEKARPDKRKNDSSSEEASTPTKKLKMEIDDDYDVGNTLKPRSNRHGLPPMLSPIPSNPHGLPAMLSPTLPSDIEEALLEWEKRRPRGDSGASSSSDLKISPKSVKSETNGVNGTSTPTNAGKRPPKDLASASAAHKPRSAKMYAVKEESGEHQSPKRRLLVRLKYGKRRRKDVERILRLTPRKLASPFVYNSHALHEGTHPKATHESTRSSGLGSAAIHGRTSKEPSRNAKESHLEKAPKKRPESGMDVGKELDQRKRRRTLDASDGGASSAPEQRDNDARKSHAFATPKSHTTGMVRSLSNASAMSTPRPTTPLAAPPSAKSHRSTSAMPPLTGEKAERAGFLGELSRQWNDHGRKLKHAYEGIEIAPPRGHKPTPSDHEREDRDADAEAEAAPPLAARRKAVASLDCVAAYMLAFAFADARARVAGRPPAHGKTWATLLPLLHSVAHFTRTVPELEGLRNYLAYVVMRHMCDLMVANAAPGPPPSSSAGNGVPGRPSPDSPEDVVGAGSGGAAAAAAAAPAGSYLDPSFRSLWSRAKSALWRAMELLPAEDIQARFPRTFAARARPPTRSSSVSRASSEHGGPAAADGGEAWATLDPRRRPREDGAADAAAAREAVVRAPFVLPVGECTTCPQAARFAVAALQEWLERNPEVGWTVRALQAPVVDGA